MKRVLKIIGIGCAIVVAVVLLLRVTVVISPVSLFPIHGAGMAPTYNDGNMLLVNKYAKQFSRGDVVVFQQEKYGFMLKRIIGLPSEKVEIRDGRVFINGAELREDYYKGQTEPDLSVNLTDDQYFILGDNRSSSADSRSFGPIARSTIKAKVNRVLFRFK